MAQNLCLDWRGTRYELDIDSITPRIYKPIRTQLGLKWGQFLNAFIDLDNMEAEVAPALMYLFRKQAGEVDVKIDEDIPLAEFLASLSNVGEPVEADPKATDGMPTPG